MIPLRYSHCPHCGGKLRAETIDEQHKPRCESCRFVFYQNPIVGVAAILLKDGKVLLGKRDQSHADLWCVPCGYVEWDEHVEDACKREFQEETGLIIDLKNVYAVHSNFHNPKQHTVGIWYMAEAVGGQMIAGDDLSEVKFFSYREIPPLAFPTDRKVLDQLAAEGRLK